MNILAIDPGQTGAIATLDDTGHLITIHDMPVLEKRINPALLADILVPLQSTASICVIEDVHAMPKQGVTSSFNFGRGLGVIEGVALGAGIPVRYISPAKWKRQLGLTNDKDASRRRAIELWPNQSAMFARVKDDGRAEAALIGYWWIHFGDTSQPGGNQ